MNACVLTIGDELLQGFTIDTNSTWLGTTLLPYGIYITKKITVGDDLEIIKKIVQELLDDNFDMLFITGGLGPTHDDITKEAFRQLFNDEYYLDEEYYHKLKLRFEKRIKKMPEINKSQAMMLKKANPILNEIGSALGLYFLQQSTQIFVMPGVPREMKIMIQNQIIPKYFKSSPKNKFITLKTAGVMESHLAEQASSLIKKYTGAFKFAFLPHYNGVSFRINQIESSQNIEKVSEEFISVMRPYYYGKNEDTLESVLGKLLIKKGHTIALAESCTGGLIGKRLTDVSGSSNYFLGSITAYSNSLKEQLLNVSSNTIESFGAVSEEIAIEMAEKIKTTTNAHIGVSTTGISGPTGGSEEKPVGLVYIGIATPFKSFVKKYNFPFNRYIHREMTATAALNLVRLSYNDLA